MNFYNNTWAKIAAFTLIYLKNNNNNIGYKKCYAGNKQL